MDDHDTINIAVETLENRARALVAEQNRLRLRIVQDCVRDRELSRAIGGCISGANALGHDFDLPDREVMTEGRETGELKAYITARSNLIPLLHHFAKRVPAELGPEIAPYVSNVSRPPQSMPRVSDVILEQLRKAAEKGLKAADIRRFILDTYQTEIHEKTVGMTLYRLQKGGSVRREGHIWFLAP